LLHHWLSEKSNKGPCCDGATMLALGTATQSH
jgi:hypothetical protein